MILESMLHRLSEEQTRFAHEVMQQPALGDFNYGKAVGMYAGLEMAKRILLDLVDEKERRDFTL